MTAEIVIVVPVLGRPQNAQPLVDSIRAATTVEYEVVFVASRDDDAEFAACEATGCRVLPNGRLPRAGDWAKKINALYKLHKAPFLLLGADDLRFHPGWDTAALELAVQGYGVVGTNDLGNGTVMRGDHSTHPLVSRHYIDACGTVDECGKVVHEGYTHNFVDVELVETAKARGAWAFAADSHVEHRHHLWGKGEDDATYRLGREHYAEDHRLLASRRKLWEKVAA